MNQSIFEKENGIDNLQVGLEFIDLSNITNSLGDKLKKLFNFFSSENDLINGLDPKSIYLPEKYRDFVNKTKDLQFTVWKDTIIDVPENFSGNWDEYLGDLLEAVKFMEEYNAIFTRYKIILSELINNKDARKSLQDIDDLIVDVQNKRMKFSTLIGNYFEYNTGKSLTKLGKVITRWADMDSINQRAFKLDKFISGDNLKSLQSVMLSTNNTLSILIKRIEQDKIAEELTEHAIDNLAKSSYEIGKYLEFYAVIFNSIRNILYAIEKLYIKMENVK